MGGQDCLRWPDRSIKRHKPEDTGYHAPLLLRRAKLRLALPRERHSERLENPLTEWDMLQGLIKAYREGDAPVARVYLEQHAGTRQQVILSLLRVWSEVMADKVLQQEGKSLLYDLQ